MLLPSLSTMLITERAQMAPLPEMNREPSFTRADFRYKSPVWLTVMAPAQVIEVKDLPPEVLDSRTSAAPAGGPATFTALSSGAGTPVNLPGGTVPVTHADSEDTAYQSGLVSSAAEHALATGLLPMAASSTWQTGLEQEALVLLNGGQTDVWDVLSRRFETSLIQAALATTRGRRIEAAQKLGIGRNTITRKIQELGIDD